MPKSRLKQQSAKRSKARPRQSSLKSSGTKFLRPKSEEEFQVLVLVVFVQRVQGAAAAEDAQHQSDDEFAGRDLALLSVPTYAIVDGVNEAYLVYQRAEQP